MANFCVNCGSKLEDYYNFCMNCGAKIDKSDRQQYDSFLNQHSDSIEKKKAKQKLNLVLGGIFSLDNAFIKTLDYYGLDYIETRKAIKQQVEKEIDSGQIKIGGVEYRVNQLVIEYKTKMEKERARIAKEKEEEKKKLKKASKEVERNRISKEKEMMGKYVRRNEVRHGGYCDLSCQYCFEEFLDSGGGIIGDFTDGCLVDYYCTLGHSVAIGRFCKDYR